jgi:hypothetical protein
MALMQLSSNGAFDDAYVPNNYYRHALESRTLTFNNDFCNITRNGDLFTPKKIMCYNCSEDFSLNLIELTIGGQSIIRINDTKFLDFIGFSENININGTVNKVYHLDKTKLFFPVKLIALQYHVVEIRITKTGNCNTIKLNGVYDYLYTEERRHMAQNSHESFIKQLKIGSVENYNSGQVKSLNMNGNVNGFILTDINPNIINSIKLKLNGHERLNYEDHFEIMMNTQRINDNTIYINLNDSNYNDDVTNSSLNTSRVDNIQLQLGLDEGNDGINFKIGSYSNNILRVMSGMGGVAYAFDHDIGISNNTYTPSSSVPIYSVSTSQPWAKKPKLMVGDTLCPVMHEEIEGDYVCCHQCKKNFDSSIIDSWINPHKTCPMCRVTWNDFTIYENRNEDSPALETSISIAT